MDFIRRHFLSVDPRTLGFTRILLGLLLLLDLGKRVPGLSLWYGNDGLIPAHRMLWRPPREWMLSYLFALRETEQVAVAFAVTAVVYLCFLIGYRTRLMHVLAWFCLLSLQTRVDMLANGGDFVFVTLMLWTAFLPMGRRYSIDALLATVRTRDSDSDEALRECLRARPTRATAPVVSLAVLALLVQISVIYFFNAVHKNGATWRDGSAIYWLLHQARVVTHFGVWVREHAPMALLEVLAYATLAIEYAVPALVLSPWGKPWTRRAAVALLWGLHGSIALVSNLGIFSPTMMVFSTLLLTGDDWDALARAAQPGRGWLGGLAARQARLVERLARTLAWADGPVRAAPHSAARTALARALVVPREATVLALIVVATSQLFVENQALHRYVKIRQPRFMRAAVSYLRINQGWSMFAPEAPRTDLTVVVDAVTADGRHVDPYNELASDVADPKLRAVPARLGHDVFFCDYTVRLPWQGVYHDVFADWIFAYHKRTGRPEDRIRSFEAHVIEHDSPRPGEREPSNVRSRVFLNRRAPGEPKAVSRR